MAVTEKQTKEFWGLVVCCVFFGLEAMIAIFTYKHFFLFAEIDVFGLALGANDFVYVVQKFVGHEGNFFLDSAIVFVFRQNDPLENIQI